MAVKDVNLVVFASEQIIPNLHSILLRGAIRKDLRSVAILYTSEPQRSAGPANRLGRTIARISATLGDPDVNLVRVGSKVEDVIEALDQLILAAGQEQRWIINVTGGLKTAAIGGARWIDRPRCTVVYQEMGGAWWMLWKDHASGKITSVPADFPMVELNEAIDRIPVQTWLDLQLGEGDGFLIESEGPMPIGDEQLVQVSEKLVENGWRWGQAFSEILGVSKPDGNCFEEYVAAGLRDLGAKNLVRSFRQVTDTRQWVREGDLLCCLQGHIHFFDLKLRPVDPADQGAPVTQLYDAWSVCRRFGGIGAKATLIRPGWNPIHNEHNLALAQALGLGLLHQSHAASIFSNLASILGVAPPAEGSPLWRVEQVFAKHAENQSTVLYEPRIFPVAKTAKRGPDFGMPNFLAMRVAWLDQTGRKWGIYRNLKGLVELTIKGVKLAEANANAGTLGIRSVETSTYSTVFTFSSTSKEFLGKLLAGMNTLERDGVFSRGVTWLPVMTLLQQIEGRRSDKQAVEGINARAVGLPEEIGENGACAPTIAAESTADPNAMADSERIASCAGAVEAGQNDSGTKTIAEESVVEAVVRSVINNPILAGLVTVEGRDAKDPQRHVLVPFNPRLFSLSEGKSVTIRLTGEERAINGTTYRLGRLAEQQVASS